MEEDEVVYLKVFDQKKGDVVFEGKVSADLQPHELLHLGCFLERYLHGIHSKATNEKMRSFKGLQNHVELVAGRGRYKDFSGVLYVGADDGVLRKSKCVPSCECAMMTVCNLSHEECEKVFKSDTLEELEIYYCKLRQVPSNIAKMKKMKKLTLYGLNDLKSIPEEIGGLSNLEELWIEACEIESLPKRLKDLKMLKKICVTFMTRFQLNAEHLVVFSKLSI